jgi:hypothetical protein
LIGGIQPKLDARNREREQTKGLCGNSPPGQDFTRPTHSMPIEDTAPDERFVPERLAA